MFWGYSPALDLLSKYKFLNSLEGKTNLNILVAGATDVRHVLMTISKHYKHTDAQNLTIKFYIVDLLLEFVAREMLLMLIALEPSDKLGLKEKSNLWMEIFGNSMLRSTSAEYLIKKSYQFIRIVTNKNFQVKRMPCLDLDKLKYKEKDKLETIFRFWINNKYNMANNWDRRLRKHLGTRYDTKMGVFDWDYYMNLKELKDGDKINAREYKQWRNTGVAFTWLEKEFSISNVTLAVGIDCIGDEMVSCDYLGDIISGPFYCFGLECEDSDMMKVINDVRAKRATDITERNLMRIFHEIEHNTKYEHVGNERDLGTVITQMATLNFDDSQLNLEHCPAEDDYIPVLIKHKLIFLPTDTLDDQAKLEKYHRYFDLMCIGQGLLRKLNTNVLAMVKDNGPILMETRKFLFVKKDDHKKFADDVMLVMKEADCEKIGDCNFEEDSWVTFQVKLNKGSKPCELDEKDYNQKEEEKNQKERGICTNGRELEEKDFNQKEEEDENQKE